MRSLRPLLVVVALVAMGWALVQATRGCGSRPTEAGPPAAVGPDATGGLVPARLASEILRELPEGAGVLGVEGVDGEAYFATNREGVASVWVRAQAEDHLVWRTDSAEHLEIAGRNGSELLLVFLGAPPSAPADVWSPDLGYYGLDIEAAGVGIYPSHLEAATIEAMAGRLR